MLSLLIKNVILLIIVQVVFNETTFSTSTDCYLPTLPALEDLQFKIHPRNRTLELGSNVEAYQTVHIECKKGKLLTGRSSLFCANGEWSHDFPTCNHYCNGTLLDRLSSRAICDYRDSFLKCPKNILTGTFIQLKCAYGYTREPNSSQYLRCLSNGNFDKTPEHCEHDCGRIASNLKILPKNGTEIDASKAPWHVAIYAERDAHYNYICAGTIVSPTVIISAAHCFWDRLSKKLDNSTNFQIIAGRSSKNYSSQQSEYSQVIEVKEVHIPLEYRDQDDQYTENMALLILAKPLKYSETIAAVCFPKDLQNHGSRYIISNLDGFISIFGKNNQLERVQMKTLAYHDCMRDHLLADDKFCAYAANGSSEVLFDSSGAGFVIASRDPANDTVYYNFRGVISHTVHSKHKCYQTDRQAKVAITNIFHVTSAFKEKLLSAIKKDEQLF